ncbi:MAG TPA: hypothetical protein VKX49_18045 [Bryobacteraceae bacterium]|nr:hypothetical protein [Bryobacteraceae bacterium]
MGLLVAYYDGLCVGYQGVLPGWLRTAKGLAKVYWGTGSYVLPEFRKRLVAVHLIRKLISLRKDLIVTYFNKSLADLLIGMHFQELPPLEYLTVRLDRLDCVTHQFRRLYGSEKRWPLLRRTADILARVSRRACYPPLRAAYCRSWAQRSERALKEIDWRQDPAGELTVDDRSIPDTTPGFGRDAEAINWMMTFPWIQENGPATNPPYFFSESYDLFRYMTLYLMDKDATQRGYMVLSRAIEKGERRLKVLDFRCGAEDYRSLFWLVSKFAAEFQADEIELPREFEQYAAGLPFGSVIMRKERRRYLCYPYAKDSPLSTALDTLTLRLTDGDSPFT